MTWEIMNTTHILQENIWAIFCSIQDVLVSVPNTTSHFVLFLSSSCVCNQITLSCSAASSFSQIFGSVALGKHTGVLKACHPAGNKASFSIRSSPFSPNDGALLLFFFFCIFNNDLFRCIRIRRVETWGYSSVAALSAALLAINLGAAQVNTK